MADSENMIIPASVLTTLIERHFSLQEKTLDVTVTVLEKMIPAATAVVSMILEKEDAQRAARFEFERTTQEAAREHELRMHTLRREEELEDRKARDVVDDDRR